MFLFEINIPELVNFGAGKLYVLNYFRRVGMPGINKKTVVEFAGGLQDLVIKVGGKIVYSGERERKKKAGESKTEEMGLAKMAMVSKFASCINKVPALQNIWKKSNFRKTDRASFHLHTDERRESGKAKAFNKIVSANRRGLSIDLRPNDSNIIIPNTGRKLSNCKAILRQDRIAIINDYAEEYFIFPYAKRKMTPVGIICPFDPKKKSKVQFEMIAKWYDIPDFTPRRYKEFIFKFDSSDIEVMEKYKNCIVYFAFIEESGRGKKLKYYTFGSEEFSLSGYPDKEIIFRNDEPVKRNNEKDYLKE